MQVEWSEWPPRPDRNESLLIVDSEPVVADSIAIRDPAAEGSRATATPLRVNPQIFAHVGVAQPKVKTGTVAQPGKNVIVANRLRPNLKIFAEGLTFHIAVTRDKIQGIVSPVENPTDETLFEAAANPQEKYYLPQYRIAEQMVGGKPQFRLKLQQEGQGGTLTAYLEKFPASRIEAAARQAKELPHTIVVKLAARVQAGASRIPQELLFQEVTAEGAFVKAVHRMDSLAQLTQVFQLLTDTAYAASLVVARSTNTARPVPPDQNAIQNLNAEIQKLQQETAALANQSAALSAQVNTLKKVNVPQIRMQLAQVQAQQRNAEAQRAAKAKTLQEKQSHLNTLRTQKLFRMTAQTMECPVKPNPFVFDKDLHGYVFADVVPAQGGRVGVVVHQVPWQGRSHTYYQQSLEPSRFMFLPDSFKVARRPESPRFPMLAVSFPNPDAPPETMPVTLEYVAEPFVLGDRLEAAAAELKRRIPELNQPDRQLEFEPLLCDTAKLFLTLPRGDAGPQREEQKDAQIDLRTRLAGVVTLPMRDFQGVYDALFGESAVVFQGSVVVSLDEESGTPPEHIPVICRLNDLTGDVFDMEIEQEPGGDRVRVTLRNATESPVEVRSLRAIMVRGDGRATGDVSSDAPFPVTVQPSESLLCKLTPAMSLPGSDAIATLLDLQDIVVHPDAEAVWSVIVDQTRLPEFRKTVTVKTIPQTFADTSPDPVVAVVVDFERGDSVDLNANQLSAAAEVRIPLTDYVIRRDDSEEYRYKVTVIRVSGQTKDAEWRTDRTGILFPPIAQAATG